MAEQIWTDAHQISSIEYTCGYCTLSANMGETLTPPEFNV